MEFCFTLKYQLEDSETQADVLIECLAEEGCDDALIGIGVPGKIAMEFTRESSSAREAIQSALSDVRRAIPSAHLIEVSPDYVGLTEIAGITGMSRQNMRKLMLAHSSSFPIPVHDGNPSIWHLVDVLEWMRETDRYAIPPPILEISQVALEINLEKQISQYFISPAL